MCVQLDRMEARSYGPAAMTQEPQAESNPISEAYQRANQLNARLASKHDGAMVSEGRRVAQLLLDHVKSSVEDFDAFVAQVGRSERFSLHDSARVDKKQREMKLYYERAMGQLETIEESEARRR